MSDLVFRVISKSLIFMLSHYVFERLVDVRKFSNMLDFYYDQRLINYLPSISGKKETADLGSSFGNDFSCSKLPIFSTLFWNFANSEGGFCPVNRRALPKNISTYLLETVPALPVGPLSERCLSRRPLPSLQGRCCCHLLR